MKKVILSVLVASSLLATSCKKAKEAADKTKEATKEVAKETVNKTKEAAKEVAKEAVDKTKEMASDAVADIKVPEFKNEVVAKYAKNYAEYVKEVIASKGDATKAAALSKKAQEISKEGQAAFAKLGNQPEELKKLTGFVQALTQKMAK